MVVILMAIFARPTAQNLVPRMKILYLFLVLTFGLTTLGAAQNADTSSNYVTKRYNEVGLNALGMLQMLPFVNGGEVAFNNVAVLWRYHWGENRGNLRVGVGGKLLPGEDKTVINLRIGRDRMRQLGPKWQYIRGWEWFLSGNQASADNFRTTSGYAWINALRYDLNDRISISTESHLTVGFLLSPDNTSVDVRLLPLGSLYLSYRLFK